MHPPRDAVWPEVPDVGHPASLATSQGPVTPVIARSSRATGSAARITRWFRALDPPTYRYCRRSARCLSPSSARITTGRSRPLNAWTLVASTVRSEEHTSELQSHSELVCRLLLEKKK